MPRIKIDSTNYSGQSGLVTFFSSNSPSEPVDLGLRFIPYIRNATDIYGTYQIYFGDYDTTCSVVINSTTPVVTTTPAPTTTTTPAPTTTTTPAPPPPTAPLAPTDLLLSDNNNYSLNLLWSAPDNGGSLITDYIIQYSSNSGANWTTYIDDINISTNINITGLSPNNTYIARVAAVNLYGTGIYSSGSNPVILSLPCDFVASGLINPSCDFTVSNLPDIINTSNYVYDKSKIYTWWD